MSEASLRSALPEGARILLDTTTLITYLDGSEPVTPVAAWVIEHAVRTGRNPAVVSMITVMELLVRPLRLGARAPYHHVRDFVTHYPHITPVPIDLSVAQEAASVRASFRLPTADACIVATGLVAQVSAVVTNDRSWESRLRPISRRIDVCLLSDHLPFN